MKKAKKILIRILPIIFTAVALSGMVLIIYSGVINAETEECWERLEEGTGYMSDKIGHSFKDNLNLLERVADAIEMQQDIQQRAGVLEYIKSVRENTIFKRIDMLYPDNILLVESGDEIPLEGQIPFDELSGRGAHISSRYIDHNFNEEVIYCTAPIHDENGEVTALLIGVIACNELSNTFPVELYSGRAKMFLIDRNDGKFLIDTWNSGVSELDELENRQSLDGFETVDFISEIKDGNEGRFAFVSAINQKASYMTYAPVDGFAWSLAIMVQEDVVMEDVEQLNRALVICGILILVFILLYIAWNVFIVSGSVKNEEKAREAELEKETNRAKSIFLSSMSHDIRTPLNGIVGMLDVIDSRGNDPEVMRESLAKIRTNANYLVTLADDVLDINEIESGMISIKYEPMDINSLIEGVNIIVRPQAEDMGISYHFDTSALSHPYVLGSESHIQRILVNLVGNAIKYNKKNGDVWLSVHEADDPYGRIYTFTVKDNGIGMSEEFQSRMFSAFEQENSGARTVNRGHGLGLTIVHSLTEKMGGRIEVDSKVGEGTTFRVMIPLQRDIMHAETPQKNDIRDANVLDGIRILLVEDNELNMEIAKVILSDSGAEILTAENGRQALEIFSASEENSIDIILMDVMMPEMDGLEATRSIRSLLRKDSESVPIIAMTAGTFSDDIKKCLKAGMNDHIGKPLDVSSVIEHILRYSRREPNS